MANKTKHKCSEGISEDNEMWLYLDMIVCVYNLTCIKTGDNIAKANGGHGDEAKVECIKEIDVFIATKEEGTNA